jgi:WD40 repeat protein
MIEEKEDPKLLKTYKGHKESVLCVDFNPNGYFFNYQGNK